MESSKVKSKETEQLEKRFKKLEQEWNTFKESNSTSTTTTTYSRKLTLPSNESIKKPHRYSPRELIFNLQQESPSSTLTRNNATMMTRSNDVAVQEILQGRREAIERGKLKGRRLFQSDDESESALASSPERDVRLMSSFKDDESNSSGSERMHDNSTRGFYSSSSSSSCPLGVDNDHDVEVVANLVATIVEMRISGVCRRANTNTRYSYFLGGVVFILLAIAVCMSLARSSGGDECSLILVPT